MFHCLHIVLSFQKKLYYNILADKALKVKISQKWRKLLSVDRNTGTPVRSLADDGTYLATTDIQLSLAHSMGPDQNMRAENTVDAVSTLLKGQKIDGYAMINMSAIQVVNDMVGGVTVTIEGDFSERDKRKLQLTMEKPSIRY
ncbi:LCP family glycopolymer transferase [Blautia luti]|uniref:Cell envelope-related transcriptional attenuator domain protein n=1 Tax=Blautia luti TaxID=89014 RepID=A0A564W8H7_9FIRM|nr:LCP family protein [Blautia luti]VUX40878.1 Cell envelope-related transcriptional attenuator domain protein [Blautia luti]